MSSARVFALAAGAAIIVASVATAGPAFAHNYPIGSTPVDGSTVTEQPGTISLTTNDNLLGFGNGSALEVSGPATAPKYYGDGCATVQGASISMPAELGAAGEYTVTWQVVSTDGHPVSGTFSFDWQPTAEQTLAEGSATPPHCATAAADAPTQVATTQAPAAKASVGDLLWIGGALAAVVLAIGITLLVLRMRSRKSSVD